MMIEVPELHYNYIYFNSNYLPEGEVDPDEYNAICLRDADLLEKVQVIPCFMSHLPCWCRHFIIFAKKAFRKLGISIDRFLYPVYLKTPFKDNICFVIAAPMSVDYLNYLRNKYPGCKLVKIHRDLMKVTFATNKDYTEENMKKMFDLRMTFDSSEAQKYGISCFDEIESKIDVPISDAYPLSDVYFAGKAKDRLPKILKAYEILTSAGLKCDFCITHVPVEDRVELPGMTYKDKFIPYIEMLYKSVNSRCMLDINQSGAVGFTSRFLEAVMYNKKLIADDVYIKSSKYYNPKFIQLVDSIDQIDPTFVDDEPVDYEYAGEFSPIHLIKQIDNELVQKEKEK